jgi:hypothetical protein
LIRLPWRRSPDVTIAPSVPEWEEHPEDYEAWVAAVGDLGLRANLPEHKPPPSGSDLPEFIPIGFIVYLAVKVADSVLDSLIEQAKHFVIDRAKTRWWTKGRRVKGVIYGPDGKVLREVTWTSTEGERELLDHERPQDPPDSGA